MFHPLLSCAPLVLHNPLRVMRRDMTRLPTGSLLGYLVRSSMNSVFVRGVIENRDYVGALEGRK